MDHRHDGIGRCHGNTQDIRDGMGGFRVTGNAPEGVGLAFRHGFRESFA
jgi:hypothetical protein